MNGLAVYVLGLGALLATMGAATFALATNRDEALAKEEAAEEPTAALLPRDATPIVIKVPSEDPRLARFQGILGPDCDLSGFDAIALEVATPPTDAVPVPAPTDVVHVVSRRTSDCAVASLWVAPDWVAPEPEPAPEDGTSKEGTEEGNNSEKGDDTGNDVVVEGE